MDKPPFEDLRREPFRLFFPLGLAIGWVGVLPWFLLGLGLPLAWPSSAHALTLTQGFVCALAVGFLGTMLPRRTGAAPLRRSELLLLAAALVAVPVSLFLSQGRPFGAELSFLLCMALLCRYVLRSLRAVRAGDAGDAGARPAPPPSFVWLPCGLLFGLCGAVLLLGSALGGGSPQVEALGRQLVQQGFPLALILGLAPMLLPILATGDAGPPPAAARACGLRLGYAALALALLSSFLLEALGWLRAGLWLRAAVCVAVLLGTGLLRRGERAGLHRHLFRLALAALPAGLLCAGLWPAHRVAWLHLSFLGGFGLLTFATSVHVTLLHTGRDALATQSPLPVVLCGLALLGATALRVAAAHLPGHYLAVLGGAAALWLLAGIGWLLFLLPMLLGASFRQRPVVKKTRAV